MTPNTTIPKQVEVLYDDPSHTYFFAGTLYLSATGIVSKFYEKFDTEAKAEWMAYRYGQTPDYWITKWRTHNQRSLDRGNDIHDRQEQFLYNRGFTRITGDREYAVRRVPFSDATKRRKISPDQLVDGCYPELKLWRHDWSIAGRCDKPTLESVLGTRYAHIEDYKTNKAIEENGFIDKFGNERMMLDPISHLPDCEFTHYSLQLSIYQYMLEYFGYQPGIRRLIHFPHEIEGLGTPNPRIKEVPYLRNEVVMMLIHLKTNGCLGIPYVK